jgi:NAD+ synthase (glutamine-hydrolysing)
MDQQLTLLMAQINPTVGAIAENLKKIIDIIHANQSKFDLIIFPELALTGYPPEDLLFRSELYQQTENALSIICKTTQHCHVIVGHPSLMAEHCYNSASVFANGNRIALYHKQCLPNYGVFDEQRYFTAGEARACVFTIKNRLLGLCICEDVWHQKPVEMVLQKGAEILVCINASPFDLNKYKQRESLLIAHAKQGLIIVYVNQVGGQDELIFDGQSLVIDKHQTIKVRSPAFVEHLEPVTIDKNAVKGNIAPLLEKYALIYEALVLGLRDYVDKNKFPGVLIGLSGGIDSALTLAIAVDALGASRVHAIMMPSRYTANISAEDAQSQLETLQVHATTLPIEPAFTTILNTLAPVLAGKPIDTTEENLQARIRGILLMALSNKSGFMVLTTSNKSETAVGYSTLYGDMAGGFSVLKDILKTTVYKLARYRNALYPVIPERVLTRPPSAELAPNQTDQDTLPDYAILDEIITAYMEHNATAKEIILQGHDPQVVNKIIKMISQNEYKRRQAAPGIKISTRLFGREWRYPITSGFDATEPPQ